MMNKVFERSSHYLALMRMEKPIGWLLLLWPTLWALWVASDGSPATDLVWIFVSGVIVMRSAGCVINDFADRQFDPLVERTKQRPIAAGLVTPKEAIVLFLVLCAIALSLLLLLPRSVWPWSIPAVVITVAYPFMKRFIQAPQMVLGLAFSFGMPMVYVACDKAFDFTFVILFVMNFLWVVLFDTAYAMADREDDLKIGVKSTAILFGTLDKKIIAVLQILVVALLIVLKNELFLTNWFLISVILVIGLFVYQQYLIKDRLALPCFQAFLNNGWVGAIIWFGLLAG